VGAGPSLPPPDRLASVNPAQKALLDRLRQIVEETPTSGALNAANQPLYVNRFAQAIERRSNDGAELVAYARSKVYERETSSYNALIAAGKPELTVEAVVANSDALWASEFSDNDRAAARERLGAMVEAHRAEQEAKWAAAEAAAVKQDEVIVADVSAKRIAKGNPALTPEQQAEMLEDRAARRAAARTPSALPASA
jgi:hypothetical protein